MLADIALLAVHARNAGIQVPDDLEEYDREQFVRFEVYARIQWCRPIVGNSHVRNAEIVAALPEKKLYSIVFGDLKKLGIV